MPRRLRSHRHDENAEGFTLIEILIVIVILAILAAIVIFAVQSLSSEAAGTACKSDLKITQRATEVYKAQVGHYPSVGDNAAATPGGAAIPGGLTAASNGTEALFISQTGQGSLGSAGPWLKNAPVNGNHYTITLSSDGKGTVLVSDAAGVGQPDCSGVR